jgi:hypothetical protein
MIDAGFNKMPNQKAKNLPNEIKDLESQSASRQKIYRCFQTDFFVHKPTDWQPAAGSKSILFWH